MSLDSAVMNGEPMNIDSIIRERTDGASGLEDVSAIYIKEFKIILDNADSSSNLQNFEKVKLTLQSEDAKHTVPVVDAFIPDEYATERSLSVFSDRDLKPVLSGKSMKYIVGVSARRATTKELQGRLQFQFDVK